MLTAKAETVFLHHNFIFGPVPLANQYGARFEHMHWCEFKRSPSMRGRGDTLEQAAGRWFIPPSARS
jgi:hypothetical protein